MLCGLAINEHKRSLILRRFNDDAKDLAARGLEILGTRDGYNGQENTWKKGNQVIKWAGCKDEKDKERYKGRPHDLKGFDEIGDFLESQYRFIITWLRSEDPKQRCRVVCTGNPPTNPEGLWVIEYWGAWLDPNHPNPAKEGELRWYTTHPVTGKDIEVDGRGPHLIEGQECLARSRTFIRARLEDNPDLFAGDYASTLDSLPIELRRAYRDGDFGAAVGDKDFQVIPTQWVIEAQNRWTERPPYQVPMCAVGADPAGGGGDDNVMAPRYDGWYQEPIVIPGMDRPLGTDISGDIVKIRLDNAVIILDCGGGYGGSTYKTLKENDIEVIAFKGAEKCVERTQEGQLRFYNKRAWQYWRFREALDPEQAWGSPIMLPPDPEIRADLTAPTFKITPQGILIEPKDEIRKRIGRSTGKGDAITMAWSGGQRQIAFRMQAGSMSEQGLAKRSGTQTTANMGRRYAGKRRR